MDEYLWCGEHELSRSSSPSVNHLNIACDDLSGYDTCNRLCDIAVHRKGIKVVGEDILMYVGSKVCIVIHTEVHLLGEIHSSCQIQYL